MNTAFFLEEKLLVAIDTEKAVIVTAAAAASLPCATSGISLFLTPRSCTDTNATAITKATTFTTLFTNTNCFHSTENPKAAHSPAGP